VWWGYNVQDQNRLVEHDFDTQPVGWKCRNSPLRIIDKVLWKLGKEEAEGPRNEWAKDIGYKRL
jgi:hypothetical protein